MKWNETKEGSFFTDAYACQLAIVLALYARVFPFCCTCKATTQTISTNTSKTVTIVLRVCMSLYASAYKRPCLHAYAFCRMCKPVFSDAVWQLWDRQFKERWGPLRDREGWWDLGMGGGTPTEKIAFRGVEGSAQNKSRKKEGGGAKFWDKKVKKYLV